MMNSMFSFFVLNNGTKCNVECVEQYCHCLFAIDSVPSVRSIFKLATAACNLNLKKIRLELRLVF